MAMTSKELLVSALCISLGACAFKKDDDGKPTPQQTKLADEVVKKIQDGKDELNVQLKKSNISVKFEDDEPGYYRMIVSWPENVGSMDVFLDGIFVNKVLGLNSIKFKVAHSRTFNLYLRSFASAANGGRLLSEYKAEYESPKDIIFKNELTLSNDMEQTAHRIYFTNNSHIYTNGNNLQLIADQMVVDKDETTIQGSPEESFHIVTFKNPTVPAPINGKSSFIDIRSTKAIGNLKIALTGRDGLDGENGIDLARAENKVIPTTPAANGANGKNGEVSQGKRTCHSFNSDTQCIEQAPICLNPPTNGGDGANGLSGLDGTNGVNGGATGNLFVD
ncbi:MAG: hypothetical protein ACM3MG_05590, partial [Bacillota bacterium]